MVGRRYLRWSRPVVILVGLLLAATLFVARGARTSAQAGDSPGEAGHAGGSIKLVELQTLRIKAGDFHHAAAELTDVGDCAIRGMVRGLSGGSRDVRVLVFSDDQMMAWLRSPDTRGNAVALHQSPQQAAITFDVKVSRADSYHLVIWNGLPSSVDKMIEASAELTCRGTAAPR